MFPTHNSPSSHPADSHKNPNHAVAAEGSGRVHRCLELSATLLFPFLFLSALLLSYQRLSQAGWLWLAAAGALLGLVCGDFVSGLVHWAADTYGEERTPVIGRSLVKPFRVHHVRPSEICEHSIVETIGNTCILAAPLLALFALRVAHAAFGGIGGDAAGAAGEACRAVLLVFLSATL